MGTYEIYLLKSVAALSLLYIFYWLVLKNETYYSWNRMFLLLAMVISIIAPAFSFSVESIPPMIFIKVLNPVVITGGLSPVEPTKSFDLWNILSIVYISGAVFFCLRFLSSLAQIHFLYQRFPRYKYHGFKAVVLDNDRSPFTFFNILFISKNDLESGKNSEMIVHEKAHKEEYHTVDVLIMELLTIIQWFNPFIWLLRHSLRSEHEFIADNRVLLEGFDKVRYQEMLFEKSLGITSFSLTNNFNYSLLKKRLKMMTTKKSSSVKKVKYILSMPILLLALVLLVININSFANKENNSSNNGAGMADGKSIPTIQRDTTDIQDPQTMKWNRIIVESSTPTDTMAYNTVEEMPKYKTGNDADIATFIQKNLAYPKSALENKVSAKMYVHFIVDEKGTVTSVEVIKTVISGDDSKRAENNRSITDMKNEAIRVIRLLEFSPGKQDGKNARVQFVVPVAYKL